jgi:hypothetical protein
MIYNNIMYEILNENKNVNKAGRRHPGLILSLVLPDSPCFKHCTLFYSIGG